MNDKAVKPATAPLLQTIFMNPFVQKVLIVFIGCLAYSGTLHAPFQYDDFMGMLDRPFVQDLSYLSDWSLARQFSAEHAFRVRFIGFLSFALNYAIHGDAVEGYHIVNIIIHLVNALLVYSLVRLTFRTPFFEVQCSKSAYFIPFFTALLFVTHPVQTQAVTYIVQRLTSLATLFCLASVVLYIKARLALDEEGWKGRVTLWYIASLCCALLAMKTKEIAFTLPLAISIYEFMFFQGKPARRFICLTPLLLTMLVIPLSMLTLIGSEGSLGDFGSASRVNDALSRSDYLFTEMRVIVTYIRLLFLPLNQNLAYDYPVYRTLLTPSVFLSFLFLAALFGLAVSLYYRSTFKIQNPISSPLTPHSSRLIAFGIFWFFLTLSVESSIIPIPDVIFEHRLYLSSVGAFLAIASCFVVAGQKLAARVSGGGTVAVTLAGLIVLALTTASYARNQVWGSQESLWQDVVNKSPGLAVGYQYLGIALFERGEIERAFASLDRSLAIDPLLDGAYINRGSLNARVGHYQQAIADLSRAVALDPTSVEAWSNLGLTWSQLGEQDKAISCLARAIALNPTYVKALNNMGLTFIRKGAPSEAIPYLDSALSLNRNYGLAYFNRGVAYKGTGRLDRAIADLSRAIELNPHFIAAYSYRGAVLVLTGARERAIADFRITCENGDVNGCNQLQELMNR